ncbi:MAG: dihydropteroate synthase [Schwartzia sp.]|nr:dihydropteroate synthase [Schwartzia sp. (in: firmicutes)]
MELKRLEVCDARAAEEALQAVGADPRGVAIMKEKAVFRVVKVEGVPVRAANLLKQEFLAHGAEAAVSKEAAAFSAETTDVVLMGTLAQYRAILPRLREQPFGLRALSEALEKFLWENS